MKKNVLFALLVPVLLMSCTSDDSENNTGTGISNSPVSGKLYGKNFTIAGGKASLVMFSGVESADIVISAQALGCSASSTSANFPIDIITPSAVGTYTTNVYVTFNDPDTDDFVSVSGGTTVEITSSTPTMIKGKIKTSSTTTNNNINGTFEIPICE